MLRKATPAWWQYIAIVSICIICYGNALNGEFVFDDSVAIVQNADVTKPATNPLQQIFTHDFWGNNITDPTSHKSYRPLTILTFRWETQFYGQLNATYMKIVNLSLHCVVCCLLLHVVNALFSFQSEIGFLSTILFAVHPIHTEAVAGIVGRAELLCTLMFLLVIHTYLRIERNKKSFVNYVQLMILSAAAVLFKETGITALPTCIAYDIITNTSLPKKLHRFSTKLKLTSKGVGRRISFAFISTMSLMYIRLLIINFESPTFKPMDNPVAASDSLITRILNQSFLYSLNLWLLLCPDWLSFDWALGSIQLIELPNDIRCISIVLTYLILCLFIYNGSKRTHLALAILIVPFLPASGIIRLGFVIAERILYIPSIGFCILVAIGFQRLCNQFTNYKRICYVFLALTLTMMCLKTRARAYEWTNEDILFKSALRVCPNNAKVFYNIGRLASDKNDRETAFQFYQKAISLYPDYEAAIMNLGNLYREMNDLDKAEKYLRRSIDIHEEFPAAWMNLGIVLAAKNQYTEALSSYRRALSYRKRYATCYYNLGNLYFQMNQEHMAVDSWQEAVTINSHHGKAWANILAYLDNNGRIDEVLLISEKALQFVPNEPAILFTRANAFGKIEEFEKAETIYKQIIQLRPNYPLYHVNLGVLYHRWNRRDDAIASYRTALTLDETLKSAADNLSKLLRQKQ